MSEAGEALARVRILGCGSSAGVPRVGPGPGGDWGACDPSEPRNRRTRCSILIEKTRDPETWSDATTTRVLIDTSPDLRAQLLSAGVSAIDAVWFTHEHGDQTHGIDDLRPIAQIHRRQIPVHMDAVTATQLRRRFAYCFETPDGSGYPAILALRADLKPGKRVTTQGAGGPISALVLDQDHGYMRSLGFRVGHFAYSNDMVRLPEETLEALTGLDMWVVDALRHTPHPTHANLAQALAWIERLKPRQAVLTNLHIDLDYQALNAETPAHVQPAYDGMSFMITGA